MNRRLVAAVAVSLLSLSAVPVGMLAAPAHDNAADAKLVLDLPYSHSGNNQYATIEAGEQLDQCNFQTEDRTVWYRYTPTWGTTVHISVWSDFDAILTLWVGDSPESLTFAGCSGYVGANAVESIGIDMTPGVNYWFRVAGKETEFGHYMLDVTSSSPVPPANDSFTDARLIAALPFTTRGNNQYATSEAGEPQMCASTAKTVWFKYESGRRRWLTATTWRSSFDTVLGVFTGTSLGDLTPAACNDDYRKGQHSRVTFRARRGTTYWFALGGHNGDFGRYRFRLRGE